LSAALGRELQATTDEVDLAALGARVFEPEEPSARDAAEKVLSANVLVVASPTYKATYSGLLKVFFDRFAGGSLAQKAAVPILLGGAPNHMLAVDVHFTPLLLELGATVPARGLFVLESDLEGFDAFAADWSARHAAVLLAATR
jgi:FMN reductase